MTMKELFCAAVAWGVASTQPAWVFTDAPGLCGMGIGHTTFNLTGMRHRPMAHLMNEIKEKCVGVKKCRIRPIRQDLGTVRGFEGEVHALSVAVRCSSKATFRSTMSDKMIETYALKCMDGCDSCMRSHPKRTQRLECYPDSLLVDVKDAVYGAVDQQPKVGAGPRCRLTPHLHS